MKDYYHILQVSSDADARQISQAFRRLSMRYHPDRHGGRKDFEEKFKEINEAYQVLKDPIRRWQYRRDTQPRSGAGGFTSKWDTPDFAARKRWSDTSRQRQRRPDMTEEEQGMGFSGYFWSVVLLLVFLLPFNMMEKAPSQSPERSFTAYQTEMSSAQDYAVHNVKERIDRRYQRDIQYLQKIRNIDPDLLGLNIETGYYELEGKTIRLSWEIMKLIRENQWKRN